MTFKQRLIIIALAAVLGLALAALFAQMEKHKAASASTLHAVSDDAFGSPLTRLTKHTGEKVAEGDFKGQYRLIYFGFTYCPAICPTELAKITATMKELGPGAEKIDPIFITVDPERDTVEALAKYVTLFHPRLVGITGTPEEISKTLKDYKIYAAKVKDPAMTEYTMDHSSFIYFIAPDGRLLHIFKMEDKAPAMAQTIAQWMAQESAPE